MGAFTDFILASTGEAKAVARSNSPADTWPTVSCRYINDLDLMVLFTIVTGQRYDELEFPVLHVNKRNPDAPVVYELPEPFVTMMATLSPSKIKGIATEWSQIEEFRGLHEASDLATLLKNLRRLAQQARKAKSPLLLCMAGT